MKLFRIGVLIFFISFFSGVKAQVNSDSLFGVWNDKTKADTSRLKAMYKIAFDGYLFSQPDSAFYFAQVMYDFAESVNNKKYMSVASFLQGKAHKKQSNLQKAMEYHIKSLKISEEIGYNKGMASSFNNIGNIYKNQGNLQMAMDYHMKSLKINEEIGNKTGMEGSFNNIGNVYSAQGDLQKALDYYKKSLHISEEVGNDKGMATSFNNIGIIYESQGDYQKAMDYHMKSLKIAEEIGSNYSIANSFNNIGSIYQTQGDLQKALNFYMKSLKIAEEIDQKRRMAQRLNSIGTIYQTQGDLQKAMEYLLKAKKQYQKLNIINGLNETAKSLMEVFEKLGNNKKALENHKLYVTINDSLAKMDGIEREKQRLFKEQYLLEKQADSIKHADEIILHQAEAKTQKQRSIGIAIIAVIVVLFLLVVFLQLRKLKIVHSDLVQEKKKSDNLLLNILPFSIAERLKKKEKTIADKYPEVSVLFSDIVGFTNFSDKQTPTELVEKLNVLFSKFDDLLEKYNIEKIKTIGDALMLVSGAPNKNPNHASELVKVALDMYSELECFNNLYNENLGLRIGIHTGPVVAGVMGKKKFTYDLWGDTVNVAARMESHGIPNTIHMSEATYNKVKNEFDVKNRGQIDIKGKGKMNTYTLERPVLN